MQKFAEKLKNIKASFKSDESGFTLIELIVVMAILAILVLLAAPQFLGYTKDANATSLRQDTKVLQDAAFQHNIENDVTWPLVEDSAPIEITDIGFEVEDEAKLSALLDENDVVEDLDESKLMGTRVKSLKSDLNGDNAVNFYIVTKGKNEGSVFSNKPVVDRDGNTIFGADFEDKAE